jgi:hypothetical protein
MESHVYLSAPSLNVQRLSERLSRQSTRPPGLKRNYFRGQ